MVGTPTAATMGFILKCLTGKHMIALKSIQENKILNSTGQGKIMLPFVKVSVQRINHHLQVLLIV